MNTCVVSVTSRIPDREREPYYRYATWIESLKRFDHDPVVLGMGEPFWGLMAKPFRLREWLRGGNAPADLLIVSDSFDVVHIAAPNDIGNRYEELWPDLPLVFNAEKGIFPRGDLAHNFPDPGTPWRYLNSGFYIGPPALILELLESMALDEYVKDYQREDGRWLHVNDQAWYQVAFCCQPVPMVLDTECRLCQTLSACSVEEFDFSGERVRNVVTGSEPLVIHANGDGKNVLLPIFMEKLGLKD